MARDLIVNKVRESNTKGLGIQNLYQMTEALHGVIRIESKLGSGTKIEIIMPNNTLVDKGKEVVV